MNLLSLDLSTQNTGWAKFSLETGKLISFGEISPKIKNPKVKGIPTYTYPQIQLLKMRDIVNKILELLTDDVDFIVAEEINRGKNRLGQKTLDGLHYILIDRLPEKHLKRIIFIDSDGKEGWRSRQGLGLQLSDTDKIKNKEIRKFNKKVAKKDQKPIITQKTLACKMANKVFNLQLDETKRSKDSDLADALLLGHCFLMWRAK